MTKNQDEELMECIADGGDTAQTCGYQEKAKTEAEDTEQVIQPGEEKNSPEEELIECIANGGDTAQTCGYQEKGKTEAEDTEHAK